MENMNDLEPKYMTGFVVSAGMSVIALGVALLMYIGDANQPENEVLVECKITWPYVWLNSGWRIMGPEDEPWLNALAKTNKAVVQNIKGSVSCTRYQDNETPVTSLYDLVIWKKL